MTAVQYSLGSGRPRYLLSLTSPPRTRTSVTVVLTCLYPSRTCVILGVMNDKCDNDRPATRHDSTPLEYTLGFHAFLNGPLQCSFRIYCDLRLAHIVVHDSATTSVIVSPSTSASSLSVCTCHSPVQLSILPRTPEYQIQASPNVLGCITISIIQMKSYSCLLLYLLKFFPE